MRAVEDRPGKAAAEEVNKQHADFVPRDQNENTGARIKFHPVSRQSLRHAAASPALVTGPPIRAAPSRNYLPLGVQAPTETPAP